MKLTNRLSAIASFVPRGSRTADIGTDHGYIPVWLVNNDISHCITATDINAGPLKRARLSAEGISECDISFMQTNGLKGLGEDDFDTVIIAGMGGENIIEIIKSASWHWDKRHRLILQPMTKIPELCKYLYENGFMIIDEKLAIDSGEIYRIILAGTGTRKLPDISYLYAGQALFERRDPLLNQFIDNLIMKTSKAIAGIESGRRDGGDNLDILKAALSGFSRMKGMLTDGSAETHYMQ